MDYLYDGSFDGLLTCIYHHYYGDRATGIYQQAYYQPVLMAKSKVIQSDLALAGRVYRAIEKKISSSALAMSYHVYLSSSSTKENLILNYIILGFRMGPKVNLYRSHPDVYPIHKLDRQVRGEAHRFFGLLRFADTGKFLYAGFSPDHNILTLIADHFADRLRNERWIIHDQKRHLAVIYNGPEPDQDLSSKWYLTDLDNQWQKAFTQEEEHWQELWRLYFHHISIKSRYNPRLQSQLVPLRYRRHLVEFQSSFGDNVTFI